MLYSAKWRFDMNVLYLIMRNDIPSMNPGKLAAQASHVANACVKRINTGKNIKLKRMLKNWEGETGKGFGTAICLAANFDQIFDIGCQIYGQEAIFGMVDDPSYPCYVPTEVAKVMYGNCSLKDNGYSVIVREDQENSIFLRPEMVGAYLFGDKDNPNIIQHTKELKLYP